MTMIPKVPGVKTIKSRSAIKGSEGERFLGLEKGSLYGKNKIQPANVQTKLNGSSNAIKDSQLVTKRFKIEGYPELDVLSDEDWFRVVHEAQKKYPGAGSRLYDTRVQKYLAEYIVSSHKLKGPTSTNNTLAGNPKLSTHKVKSNRGNINDSNAPGYQEALTSKGTTPKEEANKVYQNYKDNEARNKFTKTDNENAIASSKNANDDYVSPGSYSVPVVRQSERIDPNYSYNSTTSDRPMYVDSHGNVSPNIKVGNRSNLPATTKRVHTGNPNRAVTDDVIYQGTPYPIVKPSMGPMIPFIAGAGLGLGGGALLLNEGNNNVADTGAAQAMIKPWDGSFLTPPPVVAKPTPIQQGTALTGLATGEGLTNSVNAGYMDTTNPTSDGRPYIQSGIPAQEKINLFNKPKPKPRDPMREWAEDDIANNDYKDWAEKRRQEYLASYEDILNKAKQQSQQQAVQQVQPQFTPYRFDPRFESNGDRVVIQDRLNIANQNMWSPMQTYLDLRKYNPRYAEAFRTSLGGR